MGKQTYKNHVRYYFPHHFIFLPLLSVMVIFGLIQAYKSESRNVDWLLFSLLAFCILFLAVMLRQHYALGNQNRIVRLEFRLRYLELYGKRVGDIENRLSFQQIAALRFAADDEFKDLLDLTLKDNLKGDEIKQRVTNWQADTMRV